MSEGGTKKTDAIRDFLAVLEDGAVEASELFEQWARRKPYRYEGEHKLAEERDKARREYHRRLARLRYKKFLKTQKVEGRLFVELSKKGALELKKRSLQQCPKLPNGFVCLVLFDFPVDARRGRDAFRNFLKGAGFTQVQKSAWQSDRHVMEDIEAFVKDAKISSWVVVYLARKP